MSETNEATPKPASRGRRSPTAVWIIKSRGKRGTTYRIRWVDPQSGRMLCETCGRDYALARIKRDQKREDLRNGIGGKLPDKLLSHLIAEIPVFMAGKRQTTIDKVLDSLKQLKAHAGDVRVTAIEPGLMMQFRAARLKMKGREGGTLSHATINKDARHIRAALTRAKSAGWIKSNPLLEWSDVRIPEPERGVRVVTPEQFAVIVAREADDTLKAVWELAYNTGMRRTELANLRWEWVNFKAGTIQVVNMPEVGEFTKSNRVRVVPMTEPIRATLTALEKAAPKIIDGGAVRLKWPHVFTWPDGRQFAPDFLTKRFVTLAEALKVDATLHDLRRSWSTLAQAAGVDKMTVKDLGGWSDVKVVEKHYTGNVLPAHKAAMERISKAVAG